VRNAKYVSHRIIKKNFYMQDLKIMKFVMYLKHNSVKKITKCIIFLY